MKKADLAKLKESLVAARSSLIARVQRTESYGREADSESEAMDLADRASSSYTKEFLFSLSTSDRAQLQLMDQALERFSDGTYGECQNCGKEIGKKRLEAVPWAHLCITCQELEEDGKL